MNKTLILHDGKYKKWNEKVEATKNYYVLKMTSNTTPSPFKASSSSEWGTFYSPFVLFDDNKLPNSPSYTSANNVPTTWVGIDFGDKTRYINIVRLTASGYEAPSSAPRDFKILGSNDGFVTSELLGEFSNQTSWSMRESREFKLIKDSNFQQYRLEINANNGGTYYTLHALEFGLETIETPSSLSIVSSTPPTKDQFLSDGMDSLSPLLDRRVETLEPLPMTDKSEILLQNGKLFAKTIDLKKYLDIRSIKVEVK